MSNPMLPWYKTKVKQINDAKDAIYEAQCEQAKDGITPPTIKRDPMSDRYRVVDDGKDVPDGEVVFDFESVHGTDEEPDITFCNYHFWGLS